MLFFLFELDWTELVTSLLRTCSGFLTDLDICRIRLEENHAPVLALQQVYSVYCNFLITPFWNAEDSEGGTKKTWYISALSFVSNTAWPLIYPKISLWELTLWNVRSIAGYRRNAKHILLIKIQSRLESRGVLPKMAYTERFHLEGVPFSGLKYMRGLGFHLLKYIKG